MDIPCLEATRYFPFKLLSRVPDIELFGAWGNHGSAAVMLMEGDIRGEFEGVSFRGNIRLATNMALGNASESNPAGMGGATWQGVAEAVSTRTFTRRTGTASITIPDLSNPLVDASIALGDQEIGAWRAMPLHRGRYESGTPGTGNHLVGNFHGPSHEETYGVFDTGSFLGAYGAKK